MKIGLLGGSFNPPHEGHLLLALRALKAARLDQVWFLVAPQNPFKSPGEYLPLDARCELCKRMVAGNPNIKISDIERKINPSCESYKTIKRLNEMCKNCEFYWIMGSDNLESLHSWKMPSYIAKNARLVCFRRGKFYQHIRSKFYTKYRNNIQIIYSGMIDVSSTKIRQTLGANWQKAYIY